MKTTIGTDEAVSRLVSAGWNRAGATALVEYLEELEADLGEELEFDAVAICCEYTEYADAIEAACDYGWTPEPGEESEKKALDYLEKKTQIIRFEGGVVVQNF